ncbi:hypothetical protein IJX73_01340 [bacterium]|nr:hypothetical protein [bacterium]MBQ9149552.1 hypothetical protein [bacterium]
MKNKLNIIIPIIYLAISIFLSFTRVPFWDEARAWLISQNCNPFEFLEMMKLECHFSLWYLAIFPFAKLDLFYPYSIYVLNSLFAFGAIYVLWNKSPFSTFQKLLITFGVPFLFLWGCVARCYSIGILFLFIALSFYKKRADKPFIYLTLLCLSLHTSVMAFIGCFYLILIFLFENIKNKNFLKFLSIFIIALFLISIQIYSPNPDYFKQAPEMGFLRDFTGYIFNPIFYIKQYGLQSILMSILRSSIIICAFIFISFCAKNNRKILFFIIPTYLSMVILFTFFYSGNFWHYFYFYLYFIVAIWIIKFENKISKPLEIMIYIILIMFLFKGSLFIDSKLTTINDSKSNLISAEIIKEYKNKKIFCLDPWGDITPSSLPFLKEIIIYDKNNQDRRSFKSMRNQIKFNTELFNPDDFAPYVTNNSILLTTSPFIKHEINNPLRQYDKNTGTIRFSGKKYIVDFIPYKFRKDISLWAYLIKVYN